MSRRCLALAPVALLASACTSGMQDPTTVETQQGACIALEGLAFESVGERECGLTPDGVAYCNWGISFEAHDDAASRFQWHYSDVAQGGSVACDGNTITSMPGTRALTGTFDPATNTLLWDGVAYELAQ